MKMPSHEGWASNFWWPGAESNRYQKSQCLRVFPGMAGKSGYKLGYKGKKQRKWVVVDPTTRRLDSTRHGKSWALFLLPACLGLSKQTAG